MQKKRRFIALMFTSLSLVSFAGVVAVDDADSPVYSNNRQFYNGQNGGTGFAAWDNGVNADMGCINSQELSLNHYWKISGTQTLRRSFESGVSLSQGRLSLAALHQTGGSLLLISTNNLPLLKIETGTFWDEELYETVNGFMLTSGGISTNLCTGTDPVGKRIDYSIEWNTVGKSYQFSAVLDQGEYLDPSTNTLSGTLAGSAEVGGIAFKTENGELHFDKISVEGIPEPATISLILFIGGSLLVIRRRFVCITILLLAGGLSSTLQAGTWTNRAGNVLQATPVSMKGDRVHFVSAQNTTTIVPLAVFPKTEQIRLQVALGEAVVPAECKAAYDFAQRSILRSRLLFQNGHRTKTQHQQAVQAAVTAFVRQLPAQMNKKQVEGLVDRLRKNES